MLEGLRGYLQLASGLTEVSRQRALATARTLLSQGGAGVEQVLPAQVREQVTGLADELLATSRANRDLLVGLVRSEVERSVSVLGLVSAEELESANRRAARLESRLRELERSIGTDQGGEASTRVAARGGSVRTTPASSTTSPETPAATTGQVRAGTAATKAPAAKAAATTGPAPKASARKGSVAKAPAATDAAAAPGNEPSPTKVSATATRAAEAKAGRSVTGPSTSAPTRSRLATTSATQRSAAVRAARKGAAQVATQRAKATKAAVGDASRTDEPATGAARSRSRAKKGRPATDASSAS